MIVDCLMSPKHVTYSGKPEVHTPKHGCTPLKTASSKMSDSDVNTKVNKRSRRHLGTSFRELRSHLNPEANKSSLVARGRTTKSGVRMPSRRLERAANHKTTISGTGLVGITFRCAKALRSTRVKGLSWEVERIK